MIDQQRACNGRLCGRVEGGWLASVGALKGREVMRNIIVEIAHFAGYGADNFGLVGGKVGEGLGAFRVLDLVFSRQSGSGWPRPLVGQGSRYQFVA